MKAIWNGTTLAESDDIMIVEGNHYFPVSSINKEYFEESGHTSICPWKGTAHYYSLKVNGERNKNAAWRYPEPSLEAATIVDRVAFWKGVELVGLF